MSYSACPSHLDHSPSSHASTRTVPPSYPTQVRVQTTSSSATITWSSPQFPATNLFSKWPTSSMNNCVWRVHHPVRMCAAGVINWFVSICLSVDTRISSLSSEGLGEGLRSSGCLVEGLEFRIEVGLAISSCMLY